MKLNIFSTLAFAAVAFAFTACDEDYKKADYDLPVAEEHDLPTATTGEIVAVTGNSAIVAAEVSSVVPSNPVIAWGVLVDTKPNVSLAGSTMFKQDASKSNAKIVLSALNDQTTYYYQTFAYTEGGVAYGEVKNFTTDSLAWAQNYELAVAGYDFSTIESIAGTFTSNLTLSQGAGVPETFVPVNIETLFGPGAGCGLASSVFANNVLFNSLQGQMVCDAAENIAGVQVSFKGMKFPEVIVSAVMMQMFFGMEGLDGHFSVYISENEITSAEDFAKATLLGSSDKNGQASIDYVQNMQTTAKNPMKFSIPADFWDLDSCYIYLHHKANYGSSLPWAENLGVLVLGFDYMFYQALNAAE
jgi:hypothetical protein